MSIPALGRRGEERCCAQRIKRPASVHAKASWAIVPEGSCFAPRLNNLLYKGRRGATPGRRSASQGYRTRAGGARHRAAELRSAQDEQKSGREGRGSWSLQFPIGSSSPPFHLTFPSFPPRSGNPAAASPRTPASHLPWSRPPLPGIPSRGAGTRPTPAGNPAVKIDVDAAMTSEMAETVAQRRNQGTVKENNDATTTESRTMGGAYYAGKQEKSQRDVRCDRSVDHCPCKEGARKDNPTPGVIVARTQ